MTDLSAPSRARDAQLSIARTAAARYDDRVIVGWELTNEFNLLMDLDMSTQNNDCIDTSKGTPASRTRADNVSTASAVSWQGAVIDVLKSADQYSRPISLGHSIARPAARWLRESYYAPIPGPAWAVDTPAEFAESTRIQHGGSADVLSAHLYAGDDNARWDGNPLSVEPLKALIAAAESMGLPLWLGEFGDDEDKAKSPHIWALTALSEMALWRKEKSNFSAAIWVWTTNASWPARDPYAVGPGPGDEDFVAKLQAFNNL